MAQETECQTPGAQYYIDIADNMMEITVEFPESFVGFSEHEVELLESNLHNAVELVLARYFATAEVTRAISLHRQRLANMVKEGFEEPLRKKALTSTMMVNSAEAKADMAKQIREELLEDPF